MPKKEIYAISDLDHLNAQQYVSTMKEFVNISPPHSNPFFLKSTTDFEDENIHHYKSLVINSEKWKSLTEVLQMKQELLLLCFDCNDTFLCMKDQVRYSNHRVMLPSELLESDISSTLSFTDKCALLYQFSILDINGMMEIPWHYLCTPQMLSIAHYLGLSMTVTQVQNSQNPSNFIEAKCKQSRCFRENYGTGSNFKYATFSFSLDSILDVLGISLQFPSSPDKSHPSVLSSGDLEKPSPKLISICKAKVNQNGYVSIKEDKLIVSSVGQLPLQESTNCKLIVTTNNKSLKTIEHAGSSLSSTSGTAVDRDLYPINSHVSTSSLTQGEAHLNVDQLQQLGVRDDASHCSAKEVSFDGHVTEPTTPILKSTPLPCKLTSCLCINGVEEHNYASNPRPIQDSIEVHRSKASKSKNRAAFRDSFEGESPLQKYLMVNNELIIHMEPVNNGDICIACKEICENSYLKCFICASKAHVSCYKTPEKDVSSNFKWFCGKCDHVSIHDILTLATDRVRSSIQSQCDFLDDSSNQQSAPMTHSSDSKQDVSSTEPAASDQENRFIYSNISIDDSNHQSNIVLQQKQVSEIMMIVEKVNQCISERISELKQFISEEVIIPQQKSYADITSEGKTTKNDHKTSFVSTKNEVMSETSNKVNKLHSVVIHNVQERKYIKDAASIKKEFNKYFEQCKIVSAFPTRSGALIVELYSREEAELVKTSWKSSFFCPENKVNDVKFNTSCKIMTHMNNFKVIVKMLKMVFQMRLSLVNYLQNIQEQYSSGLPITYEGKALQTGVIDLKTQQQLTDILDIGYLPICNMYLEVHRYISKRKVIQCYGCKEFDHVKKWCPNKYSCGNCSKEHIESECRTPSQLRCTNCRSSHSSLDKNCPVFLKKCQINRTSYSRNLNE